MVRGASIVLSLMAWAASFGGALGQEPPTPRVELLRQMGALAAQTKVGLIDSDRQFQLVEKPVFRYDDQPRRFIDATMWIWTDGGRPVACQKIEAKLELNTGQPLWGYCFTSLSTEKLDVQWADRTYRSTEPGIAFQPLADAPNPAATSAQRKRQSRELARRFSGRILQNPRTNESSAMRLLTTPIFEYADPQTSLWRGAVYGFETNGTNPDLLVIVEVGGDPEKPQWQFAPARMTTGGITLNYQDKKVWEAPFVSPGTGPFANWLFFRTLRTPVPGESTP
jgi:hypothetical protein